MPASFLSLRLLWVLVVALGIAGSAGFGVARVAAAEANGATGPAPEAKAFDIPAGEAFSTLRRFSAQSGEQLIYRADTLEGVRTNAVRGRYTAHEALGRMLAATDLTATRDARTGILAITRLARGEKTLPPAKDPSATKKKSPSP